MAEKIRSMRLNVTAGALLVLLMGVVFVIWPGAVIRTIAQMIGFILILIGVSQLVGKLFSNVNKSSGMLVGALIAVVGFWIWINPGRAASIIPVIVGVILVIHGVQNISLAFISRGYGMARWGVILFGGILNLLCGIACIAYAFGVVALGIRIVGIMLIYDGISSMLTVTRVNRYEREYIDVDFREL